MQRVFKRAEDPRPDALGDMNTKARVAGELLRGIPESDGGGVRDPRFGVVESRPVEANIEEQPGRVVAAARQIAQHRPNGANGYGHGNRPVAYRLLAQAVTGFGNSGHSI